MKSISWMLLSVLAGMMIGYGLVGPLPRPEICQKVLLDGYLDTYLHPDLQNIERSAVSMAVFSRLTIKAKLGERALAEYNRAKIIGR